MKWNVFGKRKRKITQKQREQRHLMGGVAGLVLGGYFIFILEDKLGFLIAFIGILLLNRDAVKDLLKKISGSR